MTITPTNVARWVRTVTCAGLLSLGLSLTPAYAEQPYQSGTAIALVDANSVHCQQTPEGRSCAETTVYMAKMDTATWQLCLILDTTTYSAAGWPIDRDYESGCTSVDKHGFNLDNGLRDASLSHINLTLNNTECGEEFCGPEYSRIATISGEWTGTGNISTYDHDDTFENDRCSYKYSGETLQRSATVQLAIDGETVSAYGLMFTSEFSAKIRCKK